MNISALIDSREKRIAVTPETAKKFINLGVDVTLPEGYGLSAGFCDDEYVRAGAKLSSSKIDADIYLGVKPSFEKDVLLKKGSYFIATLSPFNNQKNLDKLMQEGINLCALERIPRITRAQSMDILSSQSNIAGYRAAIVAMYEYGRVIPLMMTAAGTVRSAKVLIIGAGVAGLQAIATAKRMGAVVSAFDVRAVAKEQVESLGASFVDVESDENGETAGGYAKEMSDEYKKRQAEKLADVISKTDIVITTAQIPGKAAPRLITKDMVYSMKPGSVILDMATETGGNCELSQKDQRIVVNNVTIIGDTDFAAQLAYDASLLFSRNVFNFVSLMIKGEKIDTSDEIVQSVLLNGVSQ